MGDAPTCRELADKDVSDRFVHKDQPDPVDVVEAMIEHDCNKEDAASSLETGGSSKRFMRPLREAVENGWLRRAQGLRTYAFTDQGRKAVEGDR